MSKTTNLCLAGEGMSSADHKQGNAQIKRIKKSIRGLTFALREDEVKIGSHYRYVVDIVKKEILIILDESGDMTVSKKRTGKKVKPLFDIRKKEVRDLVSSADYLEIEVKDDCIIVYTRRKAKQSSKVVKSNIVSIEEVLGRRTGKIVIPLAMAVGSENYQYTIEDYMESLIMANNVSNISKDVVAQEVNRVYDIVSLFSGAGLFDKAWLSGGKFRFVYANDFAEEVAETYRYNIGNHMHVGDIRNVSIEDIPDADVTIGGPCCQAYSNANRRNQKSEEAEEKRLLIDDYARLVKSNVWVVENVPTILTKEQGLYFDRLCNALSDYEITATVVTDCEVGGYSKRKRAIIIGSKIGKIELPQMKVLTPATVKDALSKVNASWFNFNDVTIPSEKTRIKMSFVPQGGNWQDIPEEYNTYGPNTQSNIMRRLKSDEPAITLSNFRKSNILHPTENRIVSVSEAAAIMGLEKDFRFIGGLSAKQQMVANGVTQAIGKLVRNAVEKALDQFYQGVHFVSV